MKILLIEDDKILAKMMVSKLTRHGIHVDVAHRGYEGLNIAQRQSYDLILLDLGLDDLPGCDLLHKLRANNNSTPVSILTAHDCIDTKLKGFNLGADDYITKPFNEHELLARIYAIIRRNKGHASQIIRIDELELNLELKTAKAGSVDLELTNKEYQILELLVLNQGTTMYKEVLFEQIYTNALDIPAGKIIDVFVCKLRQKIGRAIGFDKQYIKTLWGKGYMLLADEPCAQGKVTLLNTLDSAIV